MKSQLILTTILLFFIPTGFVIPHYTIYKFNHENVLGTSFELQVSASTEEIADRTEGIALKEIDRLSALLSTYDTASEISRWLLKKDQPVHISSELYEVLALFDDWGTRTSGALSASVGVATDIWRTAERSQTLPAPSELEAASLVMAQRQWTLDEKSRTATHLTNQSLTFNSFVKGYMLEKVSGKIMSTAGVKGAVVNIGGDLIVAGDHVVEVSVADPRASAENDRPISILKLENLAIATSGNYRRGFEIAGKKFSHIIDPRSAQPASRIASATVLAPRATDAGALATAFNILSLDESLQLAGSCPGAEFKIITNEGEQIQSQGWNALQIQSDEGISVFKGPLLTIDFELARFEGRFRRPFVAVFIENRKKDAVRTLAVWYNKPRWLPDLKRWYSKNQDFVGNGEKLVTVSSATRAPGKYSLTWDGRNDHGEPLPKGTYTIYIEAAREHGTYQLIKQEIEWNGQSSHYDLKGGVEITSASVSITKGN